MEKNRNRTKYLLLVHFFLISLLLVFFISIIITNELGQVISQKQINYSNKFMLNISGHSGIYFIDIQNDEGKKAVLKVIKH